MLPESEAREEIDRLLREAGWNIQDYKCINLSSSLGVVVREFPLPRGDADYLLFVDRKAVGVIEAKPKGTTLSGVEVQAQKYAIELPDNIQYEEEILPFVYTSTGSETYFWDNRDPEPRARRVFAFHKPETLLEWAKQKDTLRARLKDLPNNTLITEGLRGCQIEAIRNLEISLAEDRPRALIQMASGSGKTFTAIYSIYRLIKYANAKRILFLVDRNTLGRQTYREFQQFVAPDDGRKFTELYNVQHLTTNKIDTVSKVCITTIQRLYSMLKGEEEFDPELEEISLFESRDEKPKEVSYNPNIPIETFDFIITDECHRSIYNLWRQVLEYFDAYIIGLTATPSKQTLGFFNQNLVTEYSHERAVADGVNVGYEVYTIKTEITSKGSKVEAGYYVDKRDKLTREVRWEQLDEDLEYSPAELDRSVVAPDQIRTIIRTFKERLFTELFPGRKEVPKTLIFAKDDSHAEDIVRIVREEFGKGNEFCEKITYKTTGKKPEDLIASFRNSYYPRIAVTVDMISTGTDIKPLECLIFMRDVKSRVLFEQMKGRGSRTISSNDLKAVTPDANYKTHFIIIDAVGVCENDKTDSRSLERKRSVAFDKLLFNIALGNRDADNITSLANRLARLDKTLSDKEREEIRSIAKRDVKELTNALLDAVDPDKKIEEAKRLFNTDEPNEEQIKEAENRLIEYACSPFDNPALRNLLIEIKKKNEQIIDTISKDNVLYAGYDEKAKERDQSIINNFRRFIEEHKDELTALQIIYNEPYSKRKITYDAIRKLADAIQKPPYNLTTEEVWKAYERLEKSRVNGSPQRVLTDIISLIRFSIGMYETLEPFTDIVEKRFNEWLKMQEESGVKFNEEQMKWLNDIKEHIARSLSISIEDFEYTPFQERGGYIRFKHIFNEKSNSILEELNEVLV